MGKQQSVGMQTGGHAERANAEECRQVHESVGKHRRVWESAGGYWKATGNCENCLFRAQGESRRIISSPLKY